MGLQTKNTDRKTFVNIINGKLTTKTEKDNALAVPRKNKKEEMVYEIHHDKLSGTIVALAITKNDFGKQLEITLSDVGDMFLLTIPVESKYFDSFAAKIGNVNLSEEVTIAPYSFQPKDADTKRTGINLYQNGNKVDYYFSEDAPKGKPFPTKEKLDDDEWKIFKLQERKFYCEFISKLTAEAPVKSEPKSYTQEIESAPAPYNDDLPF